MNMWTDKSKEMENIRLRQRIDRPEKDDPKGHRMHRAWQSKNPPDTKKTKVREQVVSRNSAYNKILRRPTMYKVGAIITTSIHTRKFITDDDEVEVLKEAKSEAEKCHIATKHDSKD
ncbi:hypothetical protein PIB30_015929 [Stylosanthes scabra]|uniref:Uncharacterized protein n=1 Tax=Stylosanthes scabra TaxID=79078 RepID=A0ABU6U664_9FABA|nr:hypothetical protein [Stylosanthes scabra]